MLLDDVADYLSTGGLGTVGTDIFKGGLYGTADPLIGIYAVGGSASVHAMRGAAGQAAVERPRVQIAVRSASMQTALQKAQAAFKLLDGMPERTINGIRYLWASAVQPPFLLDRDENQRYVTAFNVDLHRERST